MFKLCLAFAVVGCVLCAFPTPSYNNKQFQQFRSAPRLPYYPFLQRPEYYNKYYQYNKYYRPLFQPHGTATSDSVATIVADHKDIRPDGRFEYNYETNNGIRGEEYSLPKQLKSGEVSNNVEGYYSYTSPEGLQVLVQYKADENGFNPQLSYGGIGAEQFVYSPNPSSVVINRGN